VIHGLVIQDWILISAARLSLFCYRVRCRDTNISSTPILDADISAFIAMLYADKMAVGTMKSDRTKTCQDVLQIRYHNWTRNRSIWGGIVTRINPLKLNDAKLENRFKFYWMLAFRHVF